MEFAVVDGNPRGGCEELKLAGVLQFFKLGRGRGLRGAHLFPGGERVAVMSVNAEMFEDR